MCTCRRMCPTGCSRPSQRSSEGALPWHFLPGDFLRREPLRTATHSPPHNNVTHASLLPCCGAPTRLASPGCAAGAAVCGPGLSHTCASFRLRCLQAKMTQHHHCQTVPVLASHVGRCRRTRGRGSLRQPRGASTVSPRGSSWRLRTPARRRPLRSGQGRKAVSTARRCAVLARAGCVNSPHRKGCLSGLTLLTRACFTAPRRGS